MNIIIVFHSIYGHTYTLAENIKLGAQQIKGASVKIMKVRETLPENIIKEMGGEETLKSFSHIPAAQPEDLLRADCIVLGSPTYFGKVSSQMAAFMDETSCFFREHSLKNKIGGAFVSSGCQNGGAEEAIRMIHNYFFHNSMIVVGTDASDPDMERIDIVSGTSPYGVSCVSGEKYNSRPVTETEKKFARNFGKRLASFTEKLCHEN